MFRSRLGGPAMIRDPSDGSVKEITPHANEINSLSRKYGSEGITSGLPITNHKAEYLVRLEKSREWLKNWFNQNPA
jgi:hypothetical protein